MNSLVSLLVEGEDDKLFAEEVLAPYFNEKHTNLLLMKFGRRKSSFDNDYINLLEEQGIEYVLMTDLDRDSQEGKKKDFLKRIFPDIEKDRIVCIDPEIEHLYMMGVNYLWADEEGISSHYLSGDTKINKELFKAIIPKEYKDNPSDFMYKILEEEELPYSIEKAKKKSKSLRTLIEKIEDCHSETLFNPKAYENDERIQAIKEFYKARLGLKQVNLRDSNDKTGILLR